MARDYKNNDRSQRRKSGHPIQGPLWLLAGLIMGLAVAAGVHIYHLEHRPQFVADTTARKDPEQPQPSPQELPDDRPRFEFYKILPEMEVVVPEEKEPSPQPSQTQPQPAPPKTAQTKNAAAAERYLLQVGSFQTPQDADHMKAQLALLGIEANIQKVEIRGGKTWYRVRVGPFSDRDKLNQTRLRLQTNKIEAVPMKLSE
jgi:cell division protein FtsN